VNIAGSGPAVIYPQVAALAPSLLAERLREGSEPGLSIGIVRGDIREHADTPHALASLRAGDIRPTGCRAAEQSDEPATFHCLPMTAGLRQMRLSTQAIKTGNGVERNGGYCGEVRFEKPRTCMTAVGQKRR
jgi:hypothetical protein